MLSKPAIRPNITMLWECILWAVWAVLMFNFRAVVVNQLGSWVNIY